MNKTVDFIRDFKGLLDKYDLVCYCNEEYDGNDNFAGYDLEIKSKCLNDSNELDICIWSILELDRLLNDV